MRLREIVAWTVTTVLGLGMVWQLLGGSQSRSDTGQETILREQDASRARILELEMEMQRLRSEAVSSIPQETAPEQRRENLEMTELAAHVGLLQGRILSKEGKALPGVLVQIENPNDSGSGSSCTTRGNGSFQFSLLPGEYQLQFTFGYLFDNGLTEEDYRVKVEAGKITRKDIKLDVLLTEISVLDSATGQAIANLMDLPEMTMSPEKFWMQPERSWEGKILFLGLEDGSYELRSNDNTYRIPEGFRLSIAGGRPDGPILLSERPSLHICVRDTRGKTPSYVVWIRLTDSKGSKAHWNGILDPDGCGYSRQEEGPLLLEFFKTYPWGADGKEIEQEFFHQEQVLIPRSGTIEISITVPDF